MTARVDFYALKQSTEQDRALFACRLVEKAFRLGHRIYLHTDSEAAADALDDLLWEFKPESFLPHAIAGTMNEEDVPIVIGFAGSSEGPRDVLINLSRAVPPFHGEFQRIAEIVIEDEAAKQLSREHWKEYQRHGYELKHHEV